MSDLHNGIRKVKILQFTLAGSMGGRTLYILNNWKYIDKSRFQFDFVTFSPYVSVEDALHREGCKVFHISCYPGENREQFIREWESVLEQGYDILHLHTGYWDDFVAEECAKRKGIRKIILHAHNTGIGKALSGQEQMRAMEKHYMLQKRVSLNLATDYWACSAAAARWLYGEQIPYDRIRIMNNAIETVRFLYCGETRMAVRSRLHIGNDEFVIGNVGRMVYQKNQSFLLSVFAGAFHENPKVKLMLVGDGELREALHTQAKRLGIESQMIFTGKSSDTAELYQAMDLLVLPSLYEGFPLTLVEAQAAGLKCLFSDTITEEARITELAEALPLRESVWIRKLRDSAVWYERKNRQQDLVNAGFDISRQIRVIEQEYAAGL